MPYDSRSCLLPPCSLLVPFSLFHPVLCHSFHISVSNRPCSALSVILPYVYNTSVNWVCERHIQSTLLKENNASNPRNRLTAMIAEPGSLSADESGGHRECDAPDCPKFWPIRIPWSLLNDPMIDIVYIYPYKPMWKTVAFSQAKTDPQLMHEKKTCIRQKSRTRRHYVGTFLRLHSTCFAACVFVDSWLILECQVFVFCYAQGTELNQAELMWGTCCY